MSRIRVVGFSIDRAVSMFLFSLILQFIYQVSSEISNFVIAFASTALVIAAMFFFGRFHSLSVELFKKRNDVLMGVLLAIGVLLLSSIGFRLIHSSAVFLISMLLVGVSSAYYLVGWGIIFSKQGTFLSVAEIAAGFFLAILYLVIINWFPEVIRVLVFTALVVLEVAIMAEARKTTKRTTSTISVPVERQPWIFRKLLLSMFCLGIACKLSAQFFSYDGMLANFSGSVVQLGAALFVGICVIAIVLKARLRAIELIYRFSFLVVTIGCLVYFLPLRDSLIHPTLIFTGYIAILILAGTLLFSIAQKLSSRSLELIVLGIASFASGCFVAQLLDVVLLFGSWDILGNSNYLAVIIIVIQLLIYCCVLTEQDIREIEDISSLTVSEEEILETAPDIRMHCSAIGEEYSLTPREEDVLFLLAKGRSFRRIEEELFVSNSTVRTHVRHIYAKLNIHSRQELLDIVEGESQKTGRA